MQLIRNPFVENDYAGEAVLTEGAAEIYQYIDKHMVDREDDRNVLRASAAPLCVRRRWLKARGLKGHRMAPRSIINFMIGELFEYAAKHLLVEARVGRGKRYSEVIFGKKVGEFQIQKNTFTVHEQLTWKTKVGPLTITGHVDGVGRRNSDRKWEIIEFKSAGNYGFKKFNRQGPIDYLKQAHALMMLDEAGDYGILSTNFYYGRKSSGHISDKLINFDKSVEDIVKQEYLESMAPTAPQPPFSLAYEKRDGRLTGRKVALTFPCGLCEYINTPHCHNGLKKVKRKDDDGFLRVTYVLDPRGAE